MVEIRSRERAPTEARRYRLGEHRRHCAAPEGGNPFGCRPWLIEEGAKIAIDRRASARLTPLASTVGCSVSGFCLSASEFFSASLCQWTIRLWLS